MSATSIIEGKKTASNMNAKKRLFLITLLFLTACGGGGGGGDLAPRVLKTDPAAQAKNVPTTASVRATFSYPVDPVSINENTFIISGGSSISGTVTYESDTAVFTPAAPWAESTTYNAVLTTGVKDLDGIPLPSNFTWSFETAGPDTAPPTVVATTPAEGATHVSRNTPIMVTFSEPVKPETVNAGTFFVSGAEPVRIEYDPSTYTAKFLPSEMLARSVEYQVTVTTGVQDLAGNALASNKIWKFSTGISTDPVPTTPPVTPPGAPPLSTSPLVLFTYPCSEMDRERTDLKEIWVKFKQAMPSANVAGPFTLQKEDGTVIAGAFTYKESEQRAFFIPKDRLDFETWYVAGLEGIRSPSDNSITQHRWRFKTEAAQAAGPDITGPSVHCTYPPSGSTVPAPRTLRVYFNEEIDPETVHLGTFQVEPLALTFINDEDDHDDKPRRPPFWYEVDHEAAIFVLRDDIRFLPGATYKITMTTGITDLAGNHLASNDVWSFTTAQ